MLRRRLMEHLAHMPELDVVLHAGSAEELLAMLGRRPPQELPQVILMDIGLPGMDGIEATRRVSAQYPDVDVVMLTVFEDEERLFESVRAGASGYLLKDEPAIQIVRALQELQQGGAPMSPLMARKLLGYVRQPAATTTTPPPSEFASTGGAYPFELTGRELEILRLLVRGLNYVQIGDLLIISPQTVRSHIKNIYKKMHVHTRAEAVRVAMQTRTV